MPAETAMPWSPPTLCEVRLTPAGLWWDAVRAPSSLAVRALDQLGEDTGAVIEDPSGARLYWLIAPGAAADWPRLAQIEVLGDACHLVIPHKGKVRAPGPFWRVLWSPGHHLTDSAALLAALETA